VACSGISWATLQTDNHASTLPLSFFTGRMSFLPPNQQRQSTEKRMKSETKYKVDRYGTQNTRKTGVGGGSTTDRPRQPQLATPSYSHSSRSAFQSRRLPGHAARLAALSPNCRRHVFTARCYASAVLAMGLCPSVCLSVCLSQAGVLLKR